MNRRGKPLCGALPLLLLGIMVEACPGAGERMPLWSSSDSNLGGNGPVGETVVQEPDIPAPDAGVDAGPQDIEPAPDADAGPQDIEPAPDAPAPDTGADAGPQDAGVEEACLPSCAGKQCGDDGCGGRCGTCRQLEVCAAGTCETTWGGNWIPVPAGSFMMGCSPGDELCHDDEKPPHKVSLSAFHMLETEVTRAQYEAVMGKPPPTRWEAWTTPDGPAQWLAWWQAEAFCAAVGGRLPTEAEWEYAARAGTTTAYYCGSSPGCLSDVAWLGDCESAIAHAVGAKQPNDFGLYDVLGNVWEWTADTHSATYYEVSPGINPTGPEKGNYKVLRGGSCDPFDSADVRVSARLADEPVQGVYDYGARCARDAEP